MATTEERITSLESAVVQLRADLVTRLQVSALVANFDSYRTDINARLVTINTALTELKRSYVVQAQAAAQIQTYSHTQTLASTTWTIPHGLGSQYVFHIAHDGAGNQLVPDTVEYSSTNTLVLEFGSAVSGGAVISKVS